MGRIDGEKGGTRGISEPLRERTKGELGEDEGGTLQCLVHLLENMKLFSIIIGAVVNVRRSWTGEGQGYFFKVLEEWTKRFSLCYNVAG